MDLITRNEFEYVAIVSVPERTIEFIAKQPDIGFAEVHRVVSYDDCCRYVRDNLIEETEKEHFDEAASLENAVAGLEKRSRCTTLYKRCGIDGSERYEQLNYSWLDKTAGLLLTVRADITDSYQSSLRQIAAVEAARLKAEQANEAKSAFLASISHDLRTPLNGIVGFTDLALRESDPVKKQEFLRKIKAAGTLLTGLVDDTLDLSRIESGRMTMNQEAVDGNQLGSVIEMAIRPSADRKKINLKTDFSGFAGQTLWIDRLKVQKIMLNLLSNAVKYTPEGGNVSLTVTALNPPADGHTHRILVADTGIGIGAEFQKRLYEPFAQEHRQDPKSQGGTGLGLTIVKRIIDLMGGAISVESEVGKGTRFTVDLSLPAASIQAPQAIDDLTILKGKRVLLCEDNEMNSEIAVILLKEKDMIVETADDGSKGLSKFIASPEGYYDVILMDNRMPEMTGCEATQAIRSLNRSDARSVPIIAMSANAFEEDLCRAAEAGMNAYITKPLSPVLMYRTIANTLKKA